MVNPDGEGDGGEGWDRDVSGISDGSERRTAGTQELLDLDIGLELAREIRLLRRECLELIELLEHDRREIVGKYFVRGARLLLDLDHLDAAIVAIAEAHVERHLP